MWQIRAEITENAAKDDIHIRPNPTCYQCRKLVEEIKRLRRIMREEQINSMHVKNPGWYVENFSLVLLTIFIVIY